MTNISFRVNISKNARSNHMTEKNMQYINALLKASKDFPDEIIEATLTAYVSKKKGQQFSYQQEFSHYENKVDSHLMYEFEKLNFPLDIELFIEFFESLLEKDDITENGIVFTPKYISDYISSSVIKNASIQTKVIDPGCGCGIFLISAIDCIRQQTNLNYTDIINSCIYGIDLDKNNVRRCKLILNIYALINGESNEKLSPKILCSDSLKLKWDEAFTVTSFDYILGNPPYVNTHDMSKETALFLKKTFTTTKSGVYNIFYAFIEYALDFLHPQGKLSYIVPNNFLTIKSAEELRKLITSNYYLERIIDFADNMVFKPVRTYNCIIQLSKSNSKQFEYCVLDKTDDIPQSLRTITFNTMDTDKLDINGWKLVDKGTLSNLSKIEGQFHSIRNSIRTGIATLRDEVYMVDFDGQDYYKVVDDVKYVVEPMLVKRLYKIPDLKQCDDINSVCRYIIFPYKKGTNGFEIIPEDELKISFPHTYKYLLSRKEELDKRDKGKGNPIAWYAYGRTQGLNKYGNKLLFPTFAGYPRFTLIEDEYAFFCNGYAVFEPDYIDLSLLSRILNSYIMQYYVSNTSYSIEGGYYCYQKKYIERFSIPFFSEDEKMQMNGMTSSELDSYLISKYNLNL